MSSHEEFVLFWDATADKHWQFYVHKRWKQRVLAKVRAKSKKHWPVAGLFTCIPCINSFQPHRSSMRLVWLLFLIWSWEKETMKKVGLLNRISPFLARGLMLMVCEMHLLQTSFFQEKFRFPEPKHLWLQHLTFLFILGSHIEEFKAYYWVYVQGSLLIVFKGSYAVPGIKLESFTWR